MLLTLGAAGATLLVMLAVLGAPAIGACTGDERGLVACLRGMIDNRFSIDHRTDAETPPVEAPAAPVVVDKPVPKLPPAPPMVIAEAPAEPQPATTAPVVPEPGETPEAKPAVVPASETEAEVAVAPTTPWNSDLPVEAKPETPPETIALAKVIEPEPPPAAELPAPSFVPPPPTVEVKGVPPDLLATLTPEPAAAEAAPAAEPAEQAVGDAPAEAAPDVAEAPSFVPPPPTTAVEGIPPDLVAATQPEPAPDFVSPAPVPQVEGPPPDLAVASADPNPTPATEPVPSFVVPVTPTLPTTPPPDLTVAATEPVAPPAEAPAAVPVIAAPTIDAVEIEGDGNFIAGNGPAGANMRLYVDGVPAGVSPVEGGRWLVEGDDLLTRERQTLKVEALDAVTGKPLGEATIVFERPVAPIAAAPAEPVAEAPAEPVPEAPAEPAAKPPAEPAANPPVEPVAEPPAAASDPVESPVLAEDETEPADLPPIQPVAPKVETDSVTILPHPEANSITTLSATEPADSSVLGLATAPKAPALTAEFTVPPLAAAPDVTVLRARPFGDPDAGRFLSGKAIIRRGDTLWDIAHRYYGHGIHYRTIFRANRELIGRPGKIYPGQVFDLPLVYDD